MRNAFADELLTLADDDRLVVLSGDIGNRLFDKFKALRPDRFYNCGVAEANMIGVAAGLATCGMRPIAYTIAPFITARCYEQIKLDVCYHSLPVVIVGVGAGLSYASLGPTHHSFEDIAILRCLPNMSVVCPADQWETRAALRAALQLGAPIYLRLGKKGEKPVHASQPTDFRIGRALVLRDGSDVCILACGTVAPDALRTAELLADHGISAMVASFHTVKPLDTAMLSTAATRFRLIATVEEHTLIGGLGGAVAEWAADRGPAGLKLVRFGLRDEFLHESAEQAEARRRLGLAPDLVCEHILRCLR